MNEAEEKGYASASMMWLNLDDKKLKNQKKSNSIKKVNLNNNKIRSLRSVSTVFPKLESLVISNAHSILDDNGLQGIRNGDFSGFNSLTELYLGWNEIRLIS